MKGYSQLREAAAWRDVSSRGKIRVTGEDRARLLHAMTTNEVKALQSGQGCYAFFLSAQGRIMADVHILCREQDLLLDLEPESRAKIYEHLDRFIIADDAALEDLSDSLAAISVEGPLAERVLQPLFGDLPAEAYSHRASGLRTVVRASLSGSTGFLVLTPIEDKAALIAAIEAAGAVEAGDEAFRAVRLEQGKARFGEDFTERYLTQESNQMHAVSFQKGCYLGQEIVERVRSRAQIHRRLLPLRIESDQPPAPGTRFAAGGKDAAEITSAAYSPALGHVVALGYVRIDFKPGDLLESGEVRATVLPEAKPAD